MLRITRRRFIFLAAVLAAVGVAGGATAAGLELISDPPPNTPPEKLAVLDSLTTPPPNAPPPAVPNPNEPPKVVLPRGPVPNAGKVLLAKDSEIPVPGPAGMITPTSMWADRTGDAQIQIYAGSSGTNTSRGALFVWVVDLKTGTDAAGSGLFFAEQTGALTLTAVDENTITFSYNGGTGTFDIATGTMQLAPR